MCMYVCVRLSRSATVIALATDGMVTFGGHLVFGAGGLATDQLSPHTSCAGAGSRASMLAARRLSPTQDLALEVAARERWEAACRKFLRADDDGAHDSSKMYRKSAYWFLMSIDHCLRIFTGHGLEQFATAESPLDPTAGATLGAALGDDWPKRRLSVAADQHSVGLSAMNFADQVMRLSTELIADMPHRRWNSEKNAITLSGGWETILFTTVFFNVGYGPWLSASWAGALEGARAEMSRVAGEGCPLLAALMPAIAHDKGVPDRAYDADFRREVWSEIVDGAGPLARKGPRMNMCRWYGWWDCFDHWRKYWHQRLLIMLYWAISQKIITGDVQSVAMKIQGMSKGVKESGEKETMNSAKSRMASIRAAGKNQLHVATLIAMNPLVSRRSMCIYELLSPMRASHGKQIKQCESVDGAEAWYCEQACGEVWAPLDETFAVLSSPAALRGMGFRTSRAEVARWTLDHPAVGEEEDRWADWCFMLAVNLNRCRAAHLLWHIEGPGRLAALYSDDCEHTVAALSFLARVRDSLAYAADQPWPEVAKMVKRHWARRPYIKAMLDPMASDYFLDVPERIQQDARNLFGFPTTKPVEDAFQRMRVQQLRAQSSTDVGTVRAYHTLIQQGVLCRVHKYSEVNFEDCPEFISTKDIARRIPPDRFKPQKSKSVLPLSRVMTSSSKAL